MSRDAELVRARHVIRSPLSIMSMVLTTISGVVFVVVFLADWFGVHLDRRRAPG